MRCYKQKRMWSTKCSVENAVGRLLLFAEVGEPQIEGTAPHSVATKLYRENRQSVDNKENKTQIRFINMCCAN